MKKLFCPYCGSGLIIRAWRFYLVIPYYIHLWKCARPNGITVKFGVFYIV